MAQSTLSAMSIPGALACGTPSHILSPAQIRRKVSEWLEEDTPSGFDWGGFVVGDAPASARLLCKSEGVLAGIPFVNEVIRQVGCEIEWHYVEGCFLTKSDLPAVVATARGPVHALLLAERVALNALSRCSGVATASRRTLELLRRASYKNTLAGTRKTTPGFRVVEKYGMLVGGVDMHRVDLSAAVMIKDNHVWACRRAAMLRRRDESATNGEDANSNTDPHDEAITRAVHAAKAAAGFMVKVEVECQSEREAATAIKAGADVVMLDNFTPEEMRIAAASLKRRFSPFRRDDNSAAAETPREFLIEVSGGLTEENVRSYVSDDIDIISTSSIHQGVKHVDFSLKVEHDELPDSIR